MTRKEAIYELERMKTWSKELSDEEIEAIVIALKALSSSENPNTCGDAISREELIEAFGTWDKFGYAPTNELIPLRGNADKDKYVPYIHYDDVIKCIKGMPSVTPQPKTGMWIEHFDEIGKWYECDQCHTDWGGSVNYCPNCGCKMRGVEE